MAMRVLRTRKTLRKPRVSLLVVVVLMMMIIVPKHVTSTVHIEAATESEFCSRTNALLECTFTTTDETVEMNSVAAGVQEVRLVAASKLIGHPPCGTNLKIWSSNNVALQQEASPEARVLIDTPSTSTSNTRLNKEANGASETGSGTSTIIFPDDKASSSTSILRGVITSINEEINPRSRKAKAKEDSCIANVSVRQSNVHWLKGNYELLTLHSSNVQNINGTFNKVTIKNSEISNFSAAVNVAIIEKTDIETLSKLEVESLLQLRQVSIDHLTKPGINLHSRNIEGLDKASKGDFPSHELSNIRIGTMRTGQLKASGSRLSMNNITINVTGHSAIVVEAGGKATINNLFIKQGPRSCLVLQGESRVILNNFTMGTRTIVHLDMSSKDTRGTVYPLLAAWPVKTTLRITPVQTANSNTISEDDATEFIGLKWYWIGIMAAVGLISGIVVGTAIMWRKHDKKPQGLSSSLTLSEILAREKQDEESRFNTYVGPQRPDLIRQDSGQTSSSFASYTACQDRRVSSIRNLEDFDNFLLDTPDPNLFIHVSPIICSREDVIYEEVENLPMPREENQYMAMK